MTGFEEFTSQCLDSGISGLEILWRTRAELVKEALRRTKGNKSQAAILLKIHRNNLQRWQDVSKLYCPKNKCVGYK